MKHWEACGSPLGRFFSEVAQGTLGLARPLRHEIDSLCLELMEAAWKAEVGQPPPCQRCGVRLKTDEEGAQDAEGCEKCGKRRGIPTRLFSLGSYESGLGCLVASVKYRAWAMPLEALGRFLGEEILAELPEMDIPTLVIPLPSPWIRRLHRGIDHSRVLGEAVARRTGWRLCRALVRGWEPTQVGATRSERLRGGRRVRIRNRRFAAFLKGKRVVLVDDIHTTGATMARASRICHQAGVEETVAAVVATRKIAFQSEKAQGKTNSLGRNDVFSYPPPFKDLKMDLLDRPLG